MPRRIGRGDGRTAIRVGRRRVNDGKPANGSRRRRVSQSPAEQSVAGAGRAPAKQEACGRAAREGRGRAAGGASPVDSPAGGRMEVRSDSPAGGRDGGSWGTIYCCELGTGRWGQKPTAEGGVG